MLLIHAGGHVYSARVSLIDDDKELRDLLSEYLMLQGYEVLAFGDPIKALGQLKNILDDLDLLVTDMRMPFLNGLDVLKIAQGFGYIGPSLIITARGSADSERSARSLGAHYLEKPFNLLEFSSVIDNLVPKK